SRTARARPPRRSGSASGRGRPAGSSRRSAPATSPWRRDRAAGGGRGRSRRAAGDARRVVAPGVALGVASERVEEQEPGDEPDLARPAGPDQPAAGGADAAAAQQDDPAGPPHRLGKEEVLEELAGREAPEPLEDRPPDEDRLVAVEVAREPAAGAVDGGHRAELPRALPELEVERPAHDVRVAQRAGDRLEVAGRHQ